MDLRDAYRILELEAGANEEAVRDARKLLAKVWHPDRHANDPELAKKAEHKLAEINTAFEAIRAAKFPATLTPVKAARPPTGPVAVRRPPTGPITPKRPPTGPDPTSATPPKRGPTRPTPPRDGAGGDKQRIHVERDRDLLPRRRVRLSVILLIAAGLGFGVYFAMIKLARTSSQSASVAVDAAIATPDAAVVARAEPDAAAETVDDDAAAADPVTQPAGTFGLGSTREQVRAAQGEPTQIVSVITEDWRYSASQVSFDPDTGKVVGWWQIDRRLKTQLVPRDAAAAAKAKAAGHFTTGSTKDEVIAVQGTPKRIDKVINETWTYGDASRVEFDDAGRVTEWSEFDVRLHASR